jgi:16S rRNA (guanine966-N2)-methyltransferase
VRIIAGRHRGLRLTAPEGLAVRPTSDRARGALFNILTHGRRFAAGGSILVGARVLDAFAGTGALGLEALSRGAAHATFMERDRAALAALRRNVEACAETARASLLRIDATRPPPAPQACGIVFLDPPYGEGVAAPALVALADAGWLTPDGLAALEIGAREDFAPPAGFAVVDDRRYGAARILLLSRAP